MHQMLTQLKLARIPSPAACRARNCPCEEAGLETFNDRWRSAERGS